MKFFSAAALAGLVASVNAHATFQYFWTDASTSTNTCTRLPANNNPVGTTASNVACNSPDSPVSATCTVAAGSTVSVEMHQQPGDRSCSTEAIGGNHDGPVLIYMAKISDTSTSGASANWFKIWHSGLVSVNNAQAQDYTWATDVMNSNCGKVTFTIPTDILPGTYLLRAEVIALHVAGSVGGAQHYMSCYQLNVTGGGGASPATVKFPGAYSQTDPGILFNLYTSFTTYQIPGPTVYGGGGPVNPPPQSSARPASSSARPASSSAKPPSSSPVKTSSAPTSTQTAYGQCGGQGWTGPTACTSGYKCNAQNAYYSQCIPA